MAGFRHMRMALLWITFLSPTANYANEIKEKSLQDRITASDLIVIAVAQSAHLHSKPQTMLELGGFQVETVIKGGSLQVIDVVVKTGIAESDLVCCHPGKRYLLFLQRLDDGSYGSVDGPFGAYELPHLKSD